MPGGCPSLLTLESVKHSAVERLETRALANDYYKCTVMILMEASILVKTVFMLNLVFFKVIFNVFQ